MSRTELHDTFVLDGVRKTADGYLTAFARVARTGIQVYRGYELGRPDLEKVRVYRPADEVFAPDAMRSFAHRPVTMSHPAAPVTAQNWKKHARGQTGDEVVRDGDFIRVPLVLMDAAVIDAYEKDGVRELSMGYSTDIQWRTGVTDAGEQYDAVQTAIRANHLALVPVARGGDQLRLGDRDFSTSRRDDLAKSGEAMPDGSFPIVNRGDLENAIRAVGRASNPAAAKAHIKKRAKALGAEDLLPSSWTTDALTKTCPECGAKVDANADVCPSCGYEFDNNDDDIYDRGEKEMKVLVIDGLNVSVADDQSASIIQRHIDALTKSASDATALLDAAKKKEKDQEKEVADAKAAVSAKDGEIAVLKKQVTDAEITPAKLDVLVKDRLAVIDAASKLLPKEFAFDGKTLAEIRRAAVDIKLGDAAKGMDDATIGGAFAALSAGAKDEGGSKPIVDALRQRPGGASPPSTKVADEAYAEDAKRRANAWKTPGGVAA